MVKDHVIIPGTSGSGPIKARYEHFKKCTILLYMVRY
jgi:hypothetical protein